MLDIVLLKHFFNKHKDATILLYEENMIYEIS